MTEMKMTRYEQARKWGVTRRQVSKIRAGRMTLEEAREVNSLVSRNAASSYQALLPLSRSDPPNYPRAVEPPVNTRKKGTPSWHFGHFAHS